MIDTWIIENAESVQVALFFTLFAIFALVEALAPKRSGPVHRKERWLTNLVLTTLNIIVMGLLPVTFFGMAVWAQEQGYGLFNYVSLPLGVLVIGTLLARGFISFFTHYLMHKVPVLWRLHWVHHSSWQPETDSNFSAVFPIRDLIFGTFRTDTRTPQETMELGLEEVRDERTNRFLWLLGSPFLRRFTGIDGETASAVVPGGEPRSPSKVK